MSYAILYATWEDDHIRNMPHGWTDPIIELEYANPDDYIGMSFSSRLVVYKVNTQTLSMLMLSGKHNISRDGESGMFIESTFGLPVYVLVC